MYILPQNTISQKKKKKTQNFNRDFPCGSAVKAALPVPVQGVWV